MNNKHLITFREQDHQKNKEKLNRHLMRHAQNFKSKKCKMKNELSHLPRVFIIEDAGEELLNDLRKDPDVLAVEESRETTTLDMAQQPPEWSHSMIGVEQFHSRGYTGKGVKVGVIDSGCANHEDLVWAGRYNSYPNSTLPPTADKQMHGTKAAGIIGMKKNDKGYVGVAPDCLLYGVKVDNNSGLWGAESEIEAIHWLVSQGVQIINCSFGDSDDSIARYNAYLDAYTKHNVLFIVSAGNLGNVKGIDVNNSILKYPAKYPFVLTVGAVTPTKYLYRESSRGGNLSVVAPSNVMTTQPHQNNINGVDYNSIGSVYSSFGGTSCAAPHVTGLAALYKQMYPNKTAFQLREMIEGNTEDLGLDGVDKQHGYGLVVAPAPWVNPLSYKGKLTSDAIIVPSDAISATGVIPSGGYGIHFRFQPTVTGIYTFAPFNFNGAVHVYNTNYSQLGYNDVDGVVEMEMVAGQPYYIKVSGKTTNDSGSMRLRIFHPQ